MSPIRSIVLLGALASTAGCLSPTLPLPPPDEPSSMVLVRDGVWGIAGTCLPGAEVIVLDQVTGRGAAVVDLTRSGRYYVELAGSQCDLASVSQTSGGDVSETGFVIHPRQEGLPDDSTVCSP